MVSEHGLTSAELSSQRCLTRKVESLHDLFRWSFIKIGFDIKNQSDLFTDLCLNKDLTRS